ncbi:MAG: FkbM family methyltransferase [Actinobacteria bacterium]|nr:FkbM family methyltransferase [Actinomycetota bacterium]
MNADRRMAAVARAGIHQVVSRIRQQPMIVPLGRKSHVWAVRGMSASTKAFYANPPDVEMAVWQKLLVAGDLFVDVGANVGTYSLIACEAGAEVIAVEPNDQARRWLMKNIELNGYRADVRSVALSDQPGQVRITVDLGTTNRIDPAGGQIVEVDTLDSLIGERHAYVKVDVEGHELQVLRGGARALEEQRLLAVQLEWNACADRTPVSELLADYGYEVMQALPNGDLVPAGDTLHDIVAVPKTS